MKSFIFKKLYLFDECGYFLKLINIYKYCFDENYMLIKCLILYLMYFVVKVYYNF